MGLIAALLPTPRALSRLYGAVGEAHEIRVCTTWSELEAVCAGAAVSLAVVDLYADGTANFESVRGLRGAYSALPLIAYVSIEGDRSRDLFDLGRAGVVGLVQLDVDDRPRHIVQVIEQAQSRGVASSLRRYLVGQRVLVRDAVLVVVSRAHEDLTTQRLAEILLVSRRSLSDALSSAGLPSPSKLITWGRLIVAGQLLLDHHRAADSVARALAFPSGSAFRNTCQRYLGLRPNEIRAAGGPELVIARFIERSGLVSR